MKGNLYGWIIGLLPLLAAVLFFVWLGCGMPSDDNNSTKKNPHENCEYLGRDREYFRGPIVDVYFNIDHPEWGRHSH